jgi:hypothetical protein
MNMSLRIGIRKEGIDLIFPLSLLDQRKRKRHTKKQREGQSARQRRC